MLHAATAPGFLRASGCGPAERAGGGSTRFIRWALTIDNQRPDAASRLPVWNVSSSQVSTQRPDRSPMR